MAGTVWSPERCNPSRFFHNDPGIILVGRPGRVALDQQFGARPDRQASATPATVLVAHDVAPLSTVDIAVAVGKRHCVLVYCGLMARANDVANLVRQAIRQGGAIVMHDSERVLCVGVHAGSQTATVWIINDQ